MKEFKGILIPYEVLVDKNLNDKEKTIFSMILSLSKENDCIMSNSYIRDKDLSILLSMPNVVITSHQAFFTKEALNKIASDTFENIKDIFEKGSCENELKVK